MRQPWAQPCCLPWAGAVGRQTLLGTDPAPILGNYSSEEAHREREEELCQVGLDQWVEAQRSPRLL